MVIMFTELCGLYAGEKSCHQWESHNVDDDFAVAILKNSNTVYHVPWEISAGRRVAVKVGISKEACQRETTVIHIRFHSAVLPFQRTCNVQ